MKLSERLEAIARGQVWGAGDFDTLDAAIALARRVEDGHDVLVTHWEQAAFAVAGKPVPREGSIVRLVPEAGLGGGE